MSSQSNSLSNSSPTTISPTSPSNPPPESRSVNVSDFHSMELLRMIHGDWVSQIIFVAAKLKIPDILQLSENSPLTTEELAKKIRLTPQEAAEMLSQKKDNNGQISFSSNGNGNANGFSKDIGVEGVSVDMLDSVLKALRILKIIDRTNEGKWKNGPLGPLLTISHPRSLRNWSILNGELYGKFFTQLFSSVVTGTPATRSVLGDDDFYKGLDNFPLLSTHFDKAMNEMSRAAAMTIPKHLKLDVWMPVKRIVDIGGGNGGFIRALMRAIAVGKDTVAKLQERKSEANTTNGGALHVPNPTEQSVGNGNQHSASTSVPPNLPPLGVHLSQHSLSAIVLDRSSTCDSARRLPENLSISDHIQFIGSDLYDELPKAAAGADCYVIKNVLHDYSDNTCIKILGNIRNCMTSSSSSLSLSPSSPLLVIERLLDEDEQRPGLVLDAVFARLKGEIGTVDRSEGKMKKLLEQSGFRCDISVGLPTSHTIIVAYPN